MPSRWCGVRIASIPTSLPAVPPDIGARSGAYMTRTAIVTLTVSVTRERGGATMAKTERYIYKVKWLGKYETTGEIVFFTQKQINAWVKKMGSALISYSVEKIFV
jgi:hypothetical protein